MSSLAASLARILDDVRLPGDFSAGGLCDMFAPRLEVEGVGPVALPLLPVQAEAIIAVAKRAPFGRGERTMVDTDVRRTWQIGPDRVRIDGQGWARTLAEIVRRVSDGLGVSDAVTADFYKLLVYDEGSFFVGHRDTEKAPGMFATLVIVLPSASAGGDLIVRHDGREVRYDLRSPEPSQTAFAAFYADCLHEVLPVTAGHRLTLVYNLLRDPSGAAAQPPDYGAERTGLSVLLRNWDDGDRAPLKLVHPLEHAYTPAGLSFVALKGADAARAATLLGAAADAGCELHLALLAITESGSAEETGGYRSWRDQDDEATAFEVVEVHDRSETLSGWCRPDGAPSGLGPLPLCDGEVAPPDALDDMAPDDESFREATGNEGASFERSYRRAALVLWPRRDRLTVVNQGGLAATLPYLADLADRWVAADRGDRASPLWIDAHTLAGHMVNTWPVAHWRAAPAAENVGTLLTALRRLGDGQRIEGFLTEVSAKGGYRRDQADIVLETIRTLPANRAPSLIEAIVAGTAPVAFADAAGLLAEAAVRAGFRADDLQPAARTLVAAMPGDPERRSDETPWGRPRAMESGTVADLMAGLDGIDATAAEAAVDIMLRWPGTYGFDAVLVPAMLRSPRATTSAASARLRQACLAHLHARIALPLAPPKDWARDGTLRCGCVHCTDLGRFLADPSRQIWTLKAIQSQRSHVESSVLTGEIDVDCTTLRKGSPHALVCTKNEASYERRANERAKDLADWAALRHDA